MNSTNTQPAKSNPIRRHIRKAFFLFVVVLSAVGAATYLSPKGYQSRVKLQFRPGTEDSVNGDALTEKLHDLSFVTKIVDQVGPETILADADVPNEKSQPVEQSSVQRYEAIDRFTNRLSIHVSDNNVMELKYIAGKPKLAQFLLSKVLEHLKQPEPSEKSSSTRLSYLNNRTRELKQQLANLAKKRNEYKHREGLLAPQEQVRLTAARISRLEEVLLQTEAEEKSLREEVDTLTNLKNTMPNSEKTVTNTNGSLRDRMSKLQLKEQELLAKYPELHPEVKRIRQQIAAVQELTEDDSRSSTSPSPTYVALQLALGKKQPELKALKVKAKTLAKQIESEQESLAEMNRTLVRIDQLQRDFDVLEKTYRNHAEELEQTRTMQTLHTDQIATMQIIGPTLENDPVEPDIFRSMGIGLILAFGSALGLVFLAELFRQPRAPKTNKDPKAPLPLPRSP